MNTMTTQLYRELILDYWRNPRYAGKLEQPTHTATLENLLCGDVVGWTVRVAEAPRSSKAQKLKSLIIEQARFEADGCALSVAGAAVVAEAIQGKPLKEVRSINNEWVKQQLKINPGPSRQRCVTLGLEALHAAFER